MAINLIYTKKFNTKKRNIYINYAKPKPQKTPIGTCHMVLIIEEKIAKLARKQCMF